MSPRSKTCPSLRLALIPLAALLCFGMYIGTQQSWPGDYWIGIGFGALGVTACIVLTLLPSHRLLRRRSRRAQPASPETSS